MSEAKYTIELFSGGERIMHWYASNPPQPYNNGYTFADLATGEMIQITGTIIITHH